MPFSLDNTFCPGEVPKLEGTLPLHFSWFSKKKTVHTKWTIFGFISVFILIWQRSLLYTLIWSLKQFLSHTVIKKGLENSFFSKSVWRLWQSFSKVWLWGTSSTLIKHGPQRLHTWPATTLESTPLSNDLFPLQSSNSCLFFYYGSQRTPPQSPIKCHNSDPQTRAIIFRGH